MSEHLRLRKIACSNCGAELIFDPGTQMSNCNFCGSQFEIKNAVDDEIILPDGVLPFKITKDQYEQAVLEWLSEGDYTPDDILHSTVFESVNGVYLPMWFFKGRYHGNWSASSGYDRQETYLGKNSSGKLVEKTRTVTDWRPSSGQCAGEFSVLAFAGAGKGIKPDIAVYAHDTSFTRSEMKPFNTMYTMGFNMVDFTSDEHDSWDSLGKAQADVRVEIDAKNRIPGDRYKDFICDVLYDKEKPLRVYVPFWITHYKYGESEFHVYMDGTTTSRIRGVRPEDQSRKDEVKKKFLKGHFGCLSTVILFLIMVFAIDRNSTKETMTNLIYGMTVVTGVLYGVAAYQKNKIIKDSKARRQQVLDSLKS